MQGKQFFRSNVDNVRMSTATHLSIRRSSSPASRRLWVHSHRLRSARSSTCWTKRQRSHCELDPIPTWLLKRLSSYIAPVIWHICNLSLQSGVFPAQLKQARVLPLLKKSNMDPDIASYRPISNLPYISNLVVVTTRFTAHCSAFNLLPTHQSAYRLLFIPLTQPCFLSITILFVP